MTKKRRMPPRYKSGPKKGKFMSKRAAAAKRRRKPRKNPITYTKMPGVGGVKRKRKITVRTTRLSTKGKAKLKRLRAKKAALTWEALRDLKRHERKGKKTVAKRRRKSKKTKTVRRVRRGKRSHASYVKAGRKAARTKAAKKAVRRAAAKKSRRRKGTKVVRRRKSVRSRKAVRRTRRTSRRRLGRAVLPRRPRLIPYKKRRKGKRRYARVSVKRGRLHVRALRNPNFKGMLINGGMLYAGILGMRVLANLVGKYIVTPYMVKAGQSAGTAKLLQLVPAGIGFAAAAFADKVIKGKPALVNGIQLGATVALFDAIMNIFVKPMLATSAPQVAALLSGIDDVGIQGYRGYHEYIPSRPGSLGLDVHEAMAMDEYIQTPAGMGFDVSEALADSEVDSFQRGYASGSLAHTVFSV